jgi:hypothetical protein
MDSSGRNGKMLQWFETLGLPAPQVDVIDADAAYASRFYRMPSPRPTDWWWKGLLIEGKPPDKLRGAMLLPCGGDMLVLMLIGVNGDHPPIDEEGHGAYMRSLRTPYLAQAIAMCEPVSPIHGAKPLFNRWRRMDRWQGELSGYLCIGDGLATFNPFHGQGMTAAAVAAGDLGRVLAKVGTCPARLPKAFYAESKKFIRDAWTVSTTIDLSGGHSRGSASLGLSARAPISLNLS